MFLLEAIFFFIHNIFFIRILPIPIFGNVSVAIMDLPTPTSKFSPGDMVIFRGKSTCLVQSSSNQLGFNRYRLLDLDKGWEIVGSSHEITKVSVLHADTDLMSEFDVGNRAASTSDAKQARRPRFQAKSAKKIDELASKKTEKSTDKQTTWAVRIFTGFLLFYWAVLV